MDHGWELPDPAEVVELRTDGDWAALESRFDNRRPRPWRRCLEVARQCGALTAVLETRYIDSDYRSEYSEYSSKTFAAIPDSALRIHFFTKSIDPKRLWQLPDNPGYVGFIVVRPSQMGRVGRTMLAPPPDLADAVTCTVTAEVFFFGQRLSVEGVPFVQQDYQLSRCAHAAAWMCHRTAAIRGDVTQQPIAAFTIAADDDQTMGRPLPAQGLTARQLSGVLRDLGLAPISYEVGRLPGPDTTPIAEKTAAIPVICRFLNSRYPVVICTDGHAFAVIGYRRHRRRNAKDWITFVRHDDSLGPYLLVEDILNDRPDRDFPPQPWKFILAPVPERLRLTPEAAEHHGKYELLALDQLVDRDAIKRDLTLRELADSGRLTFRTYATESNRFKELAGQRRLNDHLVAEYRLARMSRLVWVVEAVDKTRRARGSAAVVGEAIYDGTSSSHDPHPLLLRVPGAGIIYKTDGGADYPIDATDRPSLSAAATEPHAPAGERWPSPPPD